jgi:hypothetical protein
VPVEPTEAMLMAGLRAVEATQGNLRQITACYKAMIEAAIKEKQV